MDIINQLQAFRAETVGIINAELDYHRASKMSFIVDDIDHLITRILEFEDNLDDAGCLHNFSDGICKTCGEVSND